MISAINIHEMHLRASFILIFIASTVLALGLFGAVSVDASDHELRCEDGTIVERPPGGEPGYSEEFCEDRGGVDAPATTNIGPLGDAESLGLPEVDASESQLQNIFTTLFVITGALATIFIIVGGLRYVTSGGSSERIEKAKNTILYAVIGLGVSIFAAVIVNFVVSNL